MVSPFAATPVRGLADDITKMTSPDLVQVSNKQDEGGGGGGDEAPKAERPEITAVTTKYDLEDALKRQSEGKAAAEKARQAAIYEQYKPQLTQRFEQFQPPKDTFQGLASLGMMMMAVGSMGGKKGLTSATGAMNAIAGMATGYQQGRKEEFDRQKAIFDENFRIMKENQAQIEKEFQYALKYAKTDLTGATNRMIQSRAAAGDNVTKESIEKNGLIPTFNEHRQATAKYNEVAEKQKAFRDAQVALLRKQLEQKEAEEKRKSEEAGIKTDKEKIELQLKQKELERGGRTVADVERERTEKLRAERIVNNRLAPQDQAERDALAKYYPDYKPPVASYGPGAFVAQALGPDAVSGFKGTEGAKALNKIAETTDAINRAERVQQLAQDPDIKFGAVAAFTQNLEQQIKANMKSFSTDKDVAAEQVRQIINSIPVNPNDKNAVFAKESAFVALAIERGERGGSVLPVGFIDRIGPLLDPKRMTKESYLSILQGRKEDLTEALTSYGFNDEEIKKLVDQRKKLSGRSPQETTAAAPEKMLNGRVITVKDGKWVYKDTGEEAR